VTCRLLAQLLGLTPQASISWKERGCSVLLVSAPYCIALVQHHWQRRACVVCVARSHVIQLDHRWRLPIMPPPPSICTAGASVYVGLWMVFYALLVLSACLSRCSVCVLGEFALLGCSSVIVFRVLGLPYTCSRFLFPSHEWKEA
jgi:hypothetical protein